MSGFPRPVRAHRADCAAMLRIDQAGEFGATRIYAGQMAVMGNRHPMARSIAHMACRKSAIAPISTR